MKILLNSAARNQGIALAVTLVLCGILGFLMGSYLCLLNTQHLVASRSQAWNGAIVVAEAGIEEALAHLNTTGITTNNLALNSWAKVADGVYGKTNFLGTSYYVVNIEIPPAITNPYPLIISTGYVAGPLQTPNLTRAVEILTRPKSALSVPGGMVLKTTYNAGGNGVTIDSFDSSNTNYSTAGLYDTAKARDKAALVSLSSAANTVMVDNAKIMGTVHTAPGGSASAGSNGSVGDSAWINGHNKGIESGHFVDDATATVPDVTLPQVSSWLPPVPGSYKINGVTYKYVLNNTSAWKLGTLDGAVYVNAPNVVLYVTDKIAISGNDQIHIAANTSMTMYVGAATASIAGKGVVNDTGLAKNFVYDGLPSNTSLSLGPNAPLTGVINAPEATLSMNGGGNDNYNFVGAFIVNSVVMGGHFNFHYDESLPSLQAPAGFVASSWDEL